MSRILHDDTLIINVDIIRWITKENKMPFRPSDDRYALRFETKGNGIQTVVYEHREDRNRMYDMIREKMSAQAKVLR